VTGVPSRFQWLLISAVLGRLGVVPEHQRQGIASRLMQWGTDFADAHGLVAFLNARPVALKLYQSCGYEVVQVTPFKFDDLEVAPVTGMLRKPVPGRKVEQ
jgi:GNAT superfamily N-acetyltransferase